MEEEYNLKIKKISCTGISYNGQIPTSPFVEFAFEGENTAIVTSELKETSDPSWNDVLTTSVSNPENKKLKVTVFSNENGQPVPLADSFTIDLQQVLQNPNGTSILENSDLTLGSETVGKINLSLRLYKFGEHDGPALIRCQIMDVQGMPEDKETYMTFQLRGSDEVIKTVINQISSNPEWHQVFTIICNNPNTDIVDINMKSGDLQIIQNLEFPVSNAKSGYKTKQSLRSQVNDEVLNVDIYFESLDLDQFNGKDVEFKVNVIDAIQLKSSKEEVKPMVKLTCGDQTETTNTDDGLTPVWNQSFTFKSTNPVEDQLTISLLDNNNNEPMANDIVMKVRDMQTSTNPIPYDVPLTLNDQSVGNLHYEITATGSMLSQAQAYGAVQVKANLVKAEFQEPNTKVLLNLLNPDESQPREAIVDQEMSFECQDPKNDALVISVVDENNQPLHQEPVAIPVSALGVNQSCQFTTTIKNNDDVIGNLQLNLIAKQRGVLTKEVLHQDEPVEIDQSMTLTSQELLESKAQIMGLSAGQSKSQLSREQSQTKSKLASKDEDEDGKCGFSWGDYGNQYSTDFTGYSNCTPLSSTIHSSEFAFHEHPTLETENNVKPKRNDKFSGKIKSFTLSPNTKNIKLIPGNEYYATARLLGKSSRKSAKSDFMPSETVKATNEQSISFDKLKFNFMQKVKPGDYLEVYLVEKNGDKKIASSLIHLETIPEDGSENVKTFDVTSAEPRSTLKPNPEKIGSLEAQVKHIVEYQ